MNTTATAAQTLAAEDADRARYADTRAFAAEHFHNLLNNVDATGGDWLVNGFVQTARNHDVDPEALRAELGRIARMLDRHDTAAKLDSLAGKVA
ncbi:hypothetical protein KDJ61_gp02 [Gordonia phage TZGordon]|uniref:Uncharacterized protein n=1 Tax=Gordonia phage TZGordon TaxID=2744004 RepID=A0A6N0A6U9_9CAUD|nr:hypothetical protein KDJ61_gp02 [Gordonia phage TZGordon]QKO02923.1 hypothetical protein SEA_TZGORDON_2 [Gordonia phage TZGordon]